MNSGCINRVYPAAVQPLPQSSTRKKALFKVGVLTSALLMGHSYAAPLAFPNYPLLGSGMPPTPNVFILYDNSVSMDGKMTPGYFIGGNDPDSRSNIARNALRSVLNGYHTKFNWGLGTFETYGSEGCVDNNARCGVYSNFQGTSSTMVFTNDCVNGISNSNGGLKCVANPEPNNGYNYLTYSIGGFEGNTAWMVGSFYKNWAWLTYAAGSTSGYTLALFDHRNPAVTTWYVSDNNSTAFSINNDFKDPFFGAGTNPISWSGCIDGGNDDCSAHGLPRQLYLKTGWIFLKSFTGAGTVVEQVKPDSTSGHYTNLLNALAPETTDLNGPDIKNGSYQTPLMGSFMTVKKYFSGLLPSGSLIQPNMISPIQNACQKNFVLLVTDGQPTADANGVLYTPAEMANATTGKAYTDLYAQIQSLRSTSFNGNNHDIKTYVLGIGGDLSSNPVAVTGLNKMAEYGGTSYSFLANDSTSMMSAFQNIVDGMGYTIPLRQSNGNIALSSSPILQNIQLYKASFSNSRSNIWEGNITKSSPTYSTPENGPVIYNTGEITGFDTGAAKWLKDNTVNGRARQIITAARQSSGQPLSGSAFVWQSMSTYMQGLITDSGETADIASKRLNYIRGDRSDEISTTNSTGFRKRDATVLGDIIDSSPVYVGPSQAGFSDSDFALGTPSFSTFSQNMFTRRAMIYVGANDGMLHGFDANTLQEVFAFIPNSVFSKLKSLSSPNYAHDFFVNETPIVAEAVVANRGWTTQLIGFPGNGGTGLFSLDVTSPGSGRPSVDLTRAENNAGNILLWELNSETDADIGYILNRGQINRSRQGLSAQIGKMANGRWAILTGNGYNAPNNTTGLVVVYLDVEGGTPSYKKIMTSSVTGGLSTPTPVDTDFDGKIDYAYAGDLQGNVWRFSLRGDENTWSAFKLFQAKVGTPAKVSPITTAPAVTYHCAKTGLMVLIGTGKYIESGDNNPNYADNHSDYLFGLWDKLDSSAISIQNLTVQSYLQGNFQNTNLAPDVAKSLILSTDNSVNWNGTSRGWMLQLYNQHPRPARIIVSPYVVDEMVYFTTISPDSDTCGRGTSWSTTQALQACTGQRPHRGVFDISYDGKVDDTDQYLLNGASVYVTGVNVQDQGRVMDASVWIDPKTFTCVTPPCRAIDTSFSELVGINRTHIPSKRLSWKEIAQTY